MNGPRFRCVLSPSAASRLDAARAFALALSSLTAADDRRRDARRRRRLRAGDRARSARRRIGLSRFSLTQLAARIAAPRLAGRGIAPASALALEAVAARAAFETARRGDLGVSDAGGRRARLSARAGAILRRPAPGGAVARGPRRRRRRPGPARPVARLVPEAERELDEARVADRTRLFEAARDAVAGRGRSWRARWCCSTSRSWHAGGGDVRAGAGGGGAARCWPRRWRRTARRGESGRAAGAELETRAPVRRRRISWRSRRTCSPMRPRQHAYERRLVRVLLGARRGARMRRDRPAAPARGAARRGLRRDGGARARAGALPRAARARARARAACPRASSAARGVPTRLAARSSRCWRAPAEGLSANRFAEYLSLGQLPAADAPPPGVGAAERRAVRRPCTARRAGRGPTIRCRSPSSRPPTTQPAIAGTLRDAPPVGADARGGGGHWRRSRAVAAAPARAGRGAARAAARRRVGPTPSRR